MYNELTLLTLYNVNNRLRIRMYIPVNIFQLPNKSFGTILLLIFTKNNIHLFILISNSHKDNFSLKVVQQVAEH